jgi:YidC/Oxa1 family membrane protein insertase
VSFNFFSLDYIYYPVSGILWVWHKVFGAVLGADNAWAWVLSVVFLVFSLRAILFKPFMKQMNSSLRMQELQPQMKKIREKYKDDRQRQSEELMKLNKEAGVNPLAGCLPALVQAPVFLALFHVLREFKPGKTENYFFNAADVQSFVDAKLFGGAPLSAFITMPQDQLDALGGIHSTVVAVAIPLMIMAGIATHMTSRRSVGRQSAEAASQQQTRIMNKVMLYLFPLGVVLGGPFFPIAILIYWLSNNTWTFGQLYFAHRIQDRQKAEVAQVVEAEEAAKRYTTPKPGARPVAKRPTDAAADGTRPLVTPTPIDRDGDDAVNTVSTDGTDGVVLNGEPLNRATGNGSAKAAGATKPGNRPAPGARPQAQRKKQRKK